MSLTGLLLRGFGPTTIGGGDTAPTAPTLSITDNADGTGGVATISGADSGTTNTVYSAPWHNTFGPSAWTSRGSRSGNGTVNVNPGNGYYWWRVQSVNGDGASESNLVYQPLTDGVESVFYRCLLAVQAVVQGLGLADVDEVKVQKVPWNQTLVEGVFVCPAPETMNPNEGTQQRDDVGYSVQVYIIRKANRSLTSNINTTLLNREKIARAFRNSRLTGVAEIIRVVVEPQIVYLPPAFDSMWDLQQLNIRCISREIRGI